VGIEDAGLGLTDIARGPGAHRRDDPAHLGDGSAEPPPDCRRALTGAVRHHDIAGPGRAGRSDAQARARADRPVANRLRGDCAWRADGFVEVAGGQGQDVLQRFGGLAARHPDLHLVAAAHAEGGDLGQAGGIDPGRVGARVANPGPGVAATYLLGQSGGRAGMQSVRVGDDETAGQFVGGLRVGGFGRGGRRAEVGDLAGQRAGCLGGDLGSRRITGGRDGGHHQSLAERGGAQHHPLAHLVVEQFEGEFGGQQRAAQVHQHHGAVTGVGVGHGVDDIGGVGAEGGVVQTRRDGDPDLLAVHHLLGQGDGGAGQRTAVRDDDEADRHVPTTVAAAVISSAADAAPGSICPTLRCPR
jgi:hypothetical protein